jgi:ElaB/YqjD/DUF883 family membrane-anchored ribosome-binding protein
MSDHFEAKKIQLIHDLRTVIHDAQALMQSTPNECRVNADELKNSMEKKLNNALSQLHHMELNASEKITHSAIKAKDYIEHHPIQAIGMSAGVGVLIGLLIKNR